MDLPATPRRPLPSIALLATGLTLLPGGDLPAQTAGPDPAFDPAELAGLEYRLIGPFRGGRVTAVTGELAQFNRAVTEAGMEPVEAPGG